MSLELSDTFYESKLNSDYKIAQENAQRKITHRFWTIPPPKGCEIFIGHIPKDCFEKELFPVFSTAGEIYEIRIIMKQSKLNKGFAFISYLNSEDAHRAIQLLNGYEIRPGFKIGVCQSRENSKLIVVMKGLNKRSEVEIFKEISEKCKTSGLVGVQKSPDQGFAVIEYESHRAACEARSFLIPRDTKLFGSEMTLDWMPEELIDADIKEMKMVS